MKKSYTLLITIALITLFSYSTISILQTKALENENISNQYLNIQAKNHMIFFKDYLKNIDLKGVNHLQIEDDFFDIYAKVKFFDSKYLINVYVKSKNYDISLYEKIVKE